MSRSLAVDERLRESREPRHVGQHLLALGLRRARAVEQVLQVLARGELARLLGHLVGGELLEIRRQFLVVVRGHDLGRQRAELALDRRRRRWRR